MTQNTFAYVQAAERVKPGFRFEHPTQGACRVRQVRGDLVRYTTANGVHASTTRDAIAALVVAGTLRPTADPSYLLPTRKPDTHTQER